MRALTISAHGGLEQLAVRGDLPVPEPGPGEVRVRMRAAALNHLDLFVVSGLPGVTITPPWVMGADGAGVVDALGPGAGGIRRGDHVVINPGLSCRQCEYCLAGDQPLCPRFRLLGEHAPGTIADYAVVPAANVRAVPPELDPVAAAAFPLATLTAWRMIVSRARVTARDLVLVWGIGGGVALQALQIAKQIGARVWVTSSDDAKLERALALGADAAFNHRRTDVAKEVRARTDKRGVDVVVDNVGAATWAQSLLALGRAGRLVSCGATSGPVVQTDVRRMFWNQWTIMGSTMGNDAEFDAVVAELRAGRLLPVVDSVFSFDQAPRAFDRLASAAQFGKVVIRIAE